MLPFCANKESTKNNVSLKIENIKKQLRLTQKKHDSYIKKKVCIVPKRNGDICTFKKYVLKKDIYYLNCEKIFTYKIGLLLCHSHIELRLWLRLS